MDGYTAVLCITFVIFFYPIWLLVGWILNIDGERWK
jgi:hypothetical protein